MASISSRPSEFKYFCQDQLLPVTQTTDSQTNLKMIQQLAQQHIRQKNIKDAKNIRVLKNGTVQILGDRNNQLDSFSIATAQEILQKAFSPVKSLVASQIPDPNVQEQVLKETSAHIPAEAAPSTSGVGDSRFRQNALDSDATFRPRQRAEEQLGSRRLLDQEGPSSLSGFSGRGASSSSRFAQAPARPQREMDDVEELREQLERLTLHNKSLQEQLRAKEVPRAAEDTAALKATLFATRKEKYDLEILKNNQKATELEQFLNHLKAHKEALVEREDVVDIYSKSSISLSDYFGDEIKEEKAFKDKMIARENKTKTTAESLISFLSFGTIGTRGDADRISDVDDEMEAVKKQLEVIKQRNTLLSNLKEVNDPDLLQIREECAQAETQITDLQKQRDFLIKQLGGESTRLSDQTYTFEDLKTLKEKANIKACTEALTKLNAEHTRLKSLVKNLELAADLEARCISLRDAATRLRQTLSSMLKSPHTLKMLPSPIPKLTDGNLQSYNRALEKSFAALKEHTDYLTTALNGLTALNVS